MAGTLPIILMVSVYSRAFSTYHTRVLLISWPSYGFMSRKKVNNLKQIINTEELFLLKPYVGFVQIFVPSLRQLLAMVQSTNNSA